MYGTARRILLLTASCAGIDRKFAVACTEAALNRTKGQVHSNYSWVVMSGHHFSRSDRQKHFLIRGFGPDGHAHHTIHAHSLQQSKDFANGGTKFGAGPGSKTLDLEVECEVLV